LSYYKLDNINILSFVTHATTNVISGSSALVPISEISSEIRLPINILNYAISTNPVVGSSTYKCPIFSLTSSGNLVMKGDTFYPFKNAEPQFTFIYFS
jgi:hypothetical protein